MNEQDPEKRSFMLRCMEIGTGVGVIVASSLVMISTPDASGPRMSAAGTFWLFGVGLAIHGAVGSAKRPDEGDDGNGGGGGWDPTPQNGGPSGGGIDREVTNLTVEDIISATEAGDRPKILEPA